MTNAKDLIINIKTVKNIQQLNLSYAAIKFVVRDDIVAGQLRLMVRSYSEHEPYNHIKKFPLSDNIDVVAKHIAKVANTMGDPRFKIKASDVIKDLK